MKARNYLLMGVVVALALSVFAPGAAAFGKIAGPAEVQAESSLKLNATKDTMRVGDALYLELSEDGEEVVWKSSDSKVASVDDEGLVVAKKAGKATISAKVDGKTLKCKITVAEKAKDGSKLTKKDFHLDRPCVIEEKIYYNYEDAVEYCVKENFLAWTSGPYMVNASSRGVGVGSTQKEVKKAFGKGIEVDKNNSIYSYEIRSMRTNGIKFDHALVYSYPQDKHTIMMFYIFNSKNKCIHTAWLYVYNQN